MIGAGIFYDAILTFCGIPASPVRFWRVPLCASMRSTEERSLHPTLSKTR